MRQAAQWLLLIALIPPPAAAQSGLVVTVTAAETRAPLRGAIVRAVRLGRTERADRVGRVRFTGLVLPETLIVTGIGFRPDTIEVRSAVDHIEASLTRTPITLAELTVTPDIQASLAPSITGEWSMPGELVRALPAAIEPDVFRALSVVPAVSFSSPLSARPIIRGYDATESVVRLDGFEILNPYHIARVFSSFPADAVESMTVAPLPATAADAKTLAGVVDIRGRRSGDETGTTGGAALSLVSASAWLGTQRPFQSFLSSRVGFLEAATDLVAEDPFQYTFYDVYAHTHFPLGSTRSWEATLYASRDDLGDRTGTGAGTDWSNVLLGNRFRIVDRAVGSLDLIGSVNRFTLDGTGIRARNSAIDLKNKFERATIGLAGAVNEGAVEVTAGGAVSRRETLHSVIVQYGDDFAPADLESSLTEFEGHADARWLMTPFVLTTGVRVDASGSVVAWQPRARLSASLGKGLSASLSAARAMRLFQVITDPQPEPTFTVYDFWFNAGENGVPTPRVDHAALDLDVVRRPWSFHGSAFLSRGDGLGELRPVWDQRTGVGALRFGDSRTYGVELHAAVGGEENARSAALTYVWSKSERRWDDGVWRPWHLDRRHHLRIHAQTRLGSRWSVLAAGEFLSGQPITSVDEVFWVGLPAGLDPGVSPGRLSYRYGPEGAGRSAGTFHMDVGIGAGFGGPGRSRLHLGLSVINLTFGPVSPEVPVEPAQLIMRDGTYSPTGVIYERLYTLPPVPTLTARIEF